MLVGTGVVVILLLEADVTTGVGGEQRRSQRYLERALVKIGEKAGISMMTRRLGSSVRAPVRDSVKAAPDFDPVPPAPRRRSIISVVLAVSLLLASCGADQPGETAAITPPPSSAGTGGEATNLFPDLDVVSVATGESLNLKAELSGGDLPVLLWFWAPH